MKNINKVLLLSLLLVFLWLPVSVFASNTNGVIDSTYKYAWGENIGWINFGCNNCNVVVSDNEITGYAWSENYGWIKLNPSESGVKNDGSGNLSGYAWGENIGWINFSGVNIDSSGYFNGYASGTISGQISFNCGNTNSCNSSDFKVRTDWRPSSTGNSSTESGGAHISLSSTGDGLLDVFMKIGETKGIYTIDTKGINFLTYINSKIIFTIEGEDKQYIAKIEKLNTITKRVKITFSPFSSVIYLTPGEIKEVDLNNDKVSDLKIKYNKLKINRIDLTFYKIKLAKNFKNKKNKSVKNKINKNIKINEKQNFAYNFTRALKLGMRGEDVKQLQKFLNLNNFKVAENGPGSPGNETIIFGRLTKQALAKFQEAYSQEILKPIGLTYGTGYFGPLTLKFVNAFNKTKN